MCRVDVLLQRIKVRQHVGIVIDVTLGECPVEDRRRSFDQIAQDLHRRANVGIALVSADRGHVVDVLDAAERLVASRPEMELLSARRGLRRSSDD